MSIVVYLPLFPMIPDGKPIDQPIQKRKEHTACFRCPDGRGHSANAAPNRQLDSLDFLI